MAWKKGRASASEAIIRRGSEAVDRFPALHNLSGYFAIQDELDPLPLLSALHGRGFKIGLPVTQPGPALIFRAWTPGLPLSRAQFGLREPGAECPEMQPQLLFVPLLGFDLLGNRLGYGAGYYDAGLRRLRRGGGAIAIGLAFDEQEFAAIPHEPQDERLDMVLTPSRSIICGA